MHCVIFILKKLQPMTGYTLLRSFAKSFFLIVSLSLLVSAVADPKTEKLVFKSSTICKTCKKTIEETLRRVDGVLVSLVNLSTKSVSVKYDPNITSEEKIKQAVLKAGYSYNDTKPSPEDYEKLPACCKKGNKSACSDPR
jgi:copper chaperone CopZ